MKAIGICALAIAAVAWAEPAAAQGEEDILSKMINKPHPSAFSVYGLKKTPTLRDDEVVQGGKALRVKVPAKGANAWDISMSGPIDKPVRAGDKIVMVFWARLVEGENGAATLTLPNNAIQLTKEPYTAFMGAPATIGPEWKMHEVKGKADRDYAPGELGFSMHLATGKQVIDFGPVFILDMGQ